MIENSVFYPCNYAAYSLVRDKKTGGAVGYIRFLSLNDVLKPVSFASSAGGQYE